MAIGGPYTLPDEIYGLPVMGRYHPDGKSCQASQPPQKPGFFRKLIRLDMMRNEPGTPSGICRKNAYAV